MKTITIQIPEDELEEILDVLWLEYEVASNTHGRTRKYEYLIARLRPDEECDFKLKDQE